MQLTDTWLARVMEITADFETTGDPWTSVSGDFDGMGISCGPMQWNFGQGSLQPLVLSVGRAVVASAMPNHSSEMWSASQGTIPAGMAIARSWQDGTKLRAGPLTEIKALLATEAMRHAMLSAARKEAHRAFKEAAVWDGKPDAPTGRAFALFFDVITQNGSFKGIDRADVNAFVAKHGPHRADDTVCDWLEAQSPASGHGRDARKNAALWRDNAAGEKLALLVLAYLRTQAANQQWRAVVMNRKGTIAMGDGWVNGERVKLEGRYPT
jgi:hypothetical protein